MPEGREGRPRALCLREESSPQRDEEAWPQPREPRARGPEPSSAQLPQGRASQSRKDGKQALTTSPWAASEAVHFQPPKKAPGVKL